VKRDAVKLLDLPGRIPSGTLAVHLGHGRTISLRRRWRSGRVPWMETITSTRGESGAPSATAGVLFQADHPSYRELWTPEGLADGTIDVSRFLAIASGATTGM